jgi:hypothetical protein
MITKFDALSMKVLPLGLKIIAHERNVLVMTNYGDEHRMLRKLAVSNLLNVNSQVPKRSPCDPIRKSNVDSN